ncbi:hypothetical protein B6U90_01690 [Thermoplasmatales archaeon ex4484_6]|nr:MAG: hypothetical protein B6U90_01690 [Thermoplasmatales archaeon ex4484_6]RLF66570.1 MAG: hypothetical protein DRN57_06845 [Thermoplasmata archaeon]
MRCLSLCMLGLAVLFLLLPSTGVMGPAGESDGAGELSATITLDPDEPNVDVDPQRGGVITFTGKVVTTQPRDFDFQFGIIRLDAVCTAGWRVTEIPVLTVTLSHRSPEFSVSVFVPQMTTATEKDQIQKIIISGNWTYEPGLLSGRIDPAEAFIHVDQVYQYSAWCEPGYVQTSPGGQFTVDLIVENQGNGDDEIDVTIDRRATMEDNGWAFIMPMSKFKVPYEGSVKIPVTVSAPTRWDGWRNVISVIRFSITSVQAAKNGDVAEDVKYSLYIRQRGVAIPGFEPALVLLSVLMVSLIVMKRRR